MAEHTFLDLIFKQKQVIRGYGHEALEHQKALGIDPRTGDNGEGDAFRHCYGAARAATEFGPLIADMLGAEKEYRDITVKGAKPGAVNMDLWNNIVGIRVARIVGEAANAPAANEDLARLCSEALQKGVLKPESRDGRPISELTDAELARIEEPGNNEPDEGEVDAQGQRAKEEQIDSRLHEFGEKLERSERVDRKDVPPDRRYDNPIA